MNLKRTALVLTLGAVAMGAMSATADAQPLQPQPAKQEVLARVQHQRHEIRVAERTGKISPMKAHRLLAADRHIARSVRAHGGRLTKVQVHRLNRQENRIHRHLQS